MAFSLFITEQLALNYNLQHFRFFCDCSEINTHFFFVRIVTSNGRSFWCEVFAGLSVFMGERREL